MMGPGRSGVWLAAVTLWLGSSAMAQSKAAAEPDRDAERRYITASVALACNALHHVGARGEAARRLANDKTLKAAGYTRTSYGTAAFEFASRPSVIAALDKGITACQVSSSFNPPGNRRYVEVLAGGQIDGSIVLRVNGGRVSGSVKGQVQDGRRFKFRFRAKMNGQTLRATDRASGSSSFSYLVEGRVVKGVFDGTLRITFGKQSFTASFPVPKI